MSVPSPYQRPNQTWICGRVREGGSCPLGPDAGGACRTTAECFPQRQGSRWVCTRSEDVGGPCVSGPLPDGKCAKPLERCTPQRSWLARRGHVTFWTVAAAIGAIAFLLDDQRRDRFILPGDLTGHHAKIVSRTDGRHCAACHTAAEGGVGRWWECASGGISALSEGGKCLECHVKDLGPQPFHPHDAVPSLLALRTDAVRGASGEPSSIAPLPPGVQGEELACITCHREHFGRDHDLKSMTDEQCQACHARKFKSFGEGHPEFRTFGRVRKAAITFNHAIHAERHFGERNETFECADCHIASRDEREVRLREFKDACGSCHAREFAGSRENPSPAVTVFRLPMLDLETLNKASVGVGQWPDLTEDDVDIDTPLPPMQRLLLRVDPAASRAMAKLGDTPLADLGGAEENAFAARDAAWGIKALLADLGERGSTALEERWKESLGVEGLSGGVKPTVFQQAVKAWVPRLKEELPLHRDSRDPETDPLGVKDAVVENRRTDGTFGEGWFRTDAERTIRYQIVGHADPFYKAWLDATVARTDDADARDVFRELARVCMKCHSAREEEGRRVIPWSAERKGRGFVAFSHGPHLKTLGSCATCHRQRGLTEEEVKLLKEPDASKRFAGITGMADRGDHGLEWMTRAACMTCHAPKGAADRCLECHRYHTTRPPR
ncbi:MAG: cytochrome c3 family protein [Planctomycetota bacterium]